MDKTILKGETSMGEKTYTVTSPVMGTFYRSSGPGEKDLVEEGQAVTPSDIVCVIESMKIFTEIRCEQEGIVKKILVENEEPVMKNQALIEIEGN
jgi:acetyl-CoA carboxylase biotin carboxyl carrier protein